jgi:hypothetical protein
VVKEYSLPIPTLNTQARIVDKANSAARMLQGIAQREDAVQRVRQVLITRLQDAQ